MKSEGIVALLVVGGIIVYFLFLRGGSEGIAEAVKRLDDPARMGSGKSFAI